MNHSMANQIKILRKARGVTQEEMGTALGLSYQAISKWENDAALPDVQMIPKIAEYFGISIDELFGYKLNALTNKERFIQFMKNNQILCLKECELQHGGTAEYYVNTENFNTNSQIARIGEYFADCIRENRLEFDTLIGLAYHGIAFSAATATALFNKYGVTVNYCHDRKVPDSRGRMIFGHSLQDGERVVIIDDVMTTGITLGQRIDQLKSAADIVVAAVIVVVNRRTQTADCGEDRIREKYGAEVYSIITDEDINASFSKSFFLTGRRNDCNI